ncbi:unnamed protein product [Didymodactylos carnosus]|uniref:JmjC domain-containing protein n=1 Tax=Didymodactylos carnosus TaxID=1234261 RepID=A0A814MNU2_9BILA|nr:unnamed protein product [Didymodactylos carnosus]CAF1081742.1 unnamed protein product [Didymodactylos carnosus]CAF3744250.1 unnamed protein product [Didymodactylos carnosus]CAF3847505.1 unnamed protein product [Didymodactylos carnosus]
MSLPFLIISLINIVYVLTQGFPKDMNLHVTFPPILERHESMPLGHLRPLGWQRRAEASVLQDSIAISPQLFYQQYVQGNRSLVLRGIVLNSPAIDKWSDVYLSKKYGLLNITVSKRKQHLVDSLETMLFSKFLQNYRHDDLYMNTIIPDEMKVETPLISLVNCGTFKHRLLEPVIWISAGDTASLLHSHSKDTIHCMIDGRKDFIILDHLDKIDGLDLVPQSNGDLYSKIDVDMVNVFKYKRLNSIPWYWVTLREGDCLYIPTQVLHQVRAHGRTISVSIDIAQPDTREDFEDEGCEKNPPSYISLDNGEFIWRYIHGRRHLARRNIETKDVQNYLLLLLGSNDQLYYSVFLDFYQQATWELKDAPDAVLIWDQLRKSTNINATMTIESDVNYIERTKIKTLSVTSAKLLAETLQRSARIHEYDKTEL